MRMKEISTAFCQYSDFPVFLCLISENITGISIHTPTNVRVIIRYTMVTPQAASFASRMSLTGHGRPMVVPTNIGYYR